MKRVDPESGDPLTATESVPSSVTAPTQVDVPFAHPHLRAVTEPELATGSSIGRYLVIGRLGAGGMGVVYTGARHRHP